MILETLKYFHQPGDVVEICAIGPTTGKHALWEGFAGGKKGTVAGWFNDLEKAAEIADKLSHLGAEGIYHTLNPCMEALLSRSDNRLKAGVDRTKDKEIVVLRWLLVDIDVISVTGVSSTDAEHAYAIEYASTIKKGLSRKGWSAPLVGDSGNGAHLLYRLPDLANTAENIELLKYVIKALKGLYPGNREGIVLQIDQKVFNPARISKLYGTMARKGDNSAARPHRISRIIERPDLQSPIPLDKLQAMCALARKEEEKTGKSRTFSPPLPSGSDSEARLDVPAYLNHYNVPVKEIKEHGPSTLYILDPCLFDPSHAGGEAAIGQNKAGQLFYQCFHDSCRGRTWADARRIISGDDKLTPFMVGLRASPGRKRKEPPGRSADNGNGKSESAAPPVDGARARAQWQERVVALNKKHAVCALGGKCVVMNERMDPVFHRPDLSFMSVPDFKNFYSNEKYWVASGNGRIKQIAIGQLWFDAPDRRQYEGIIFCPGIEIPEYYNLYRGFAVKPKPGDWTLFSDHIFAVICNGNQEIYNYVIAWLAHLFQHPGKERPGVAIVLRGRQGTGKGRFASQIGAVLGSHYLHIAHQTQVTGNFNNHLKDTLFCFVDEGIWAGDKQAEGVLRAMITEPQLAIEPKGKDVFMVQNFIRLLIATNNDWAIPAGLEERRFLVLDVSESHIQDHKYNAAIIEQMDNGGREAMLHDLMQLDISGFNLRDAPKTTALFDQILHSMPVAQKFWFEILWDGRLRPDDDDWIEQDVPYSDVFRRYAAMSERMKERRPHIHTTLIKELKKLCPGLYTVKRRNELHKLTNYLLVPPLDECRRKFEAAVHMALEWDSDNVQSKRVVI